MKYHSKIIFVRIKQYMSPQNFTNSRKIFGEFSVDFRQVLGDSYWNDCSTILVSYFSQVLFQNKLIFNGY